MDEAPMDESRSDQPPVLAAYGQRANVRSPGDQRLAVEIKQSGAGQNHANENGHVDGCEQGGGWIFPKRSGSGGYTGAAGGPAGAAITQYGRAPVFVQGQL